MMLRSLAVALVLAPTAASAYEFYETSGGDPLRWKADTMNVRLSTVAPKELSLADVDSATKTGFQQWMAGGCVPAVTVSGTTDATQGSVPTSIKGPADNVVVFINDAQKWLARGHTQEEIAVTIIANNPNTGEIVDADIEVNNAFFALTMAENPSVGQVDFVATMTHEIGHFYGLDHSGVLAATMSAKYDETDPSSKRSLEADDTTAVCELYAIPFPKDDSCSGGGAGLAMWSATLLLLAARLKRFASRRRT